MHQLAFKWCAQLLATELSIHRRSRMNHLCLNRRSWVLAGLTIERSWRMHNLRWLVWLMPQVSTTYLSITRCPRLSQLIVHQWLLIPGCCFTVARNQTVAHVRQRAEKVWRAEWWKAGTCTLNAVVVSWHIKQTCDFNNQSIQQLLVIQRMLKDFKLLDLLKISLGPQRTPQDYCTTFFYRTDNIPVHPNNAITAPKNHKIITQYNHTLGFRLSDWI